MTRFRKFAKNVLQARKRKTVFSMGVDKILPHSKHHQLQCLNDSASSYAMNICRPHHGTLVCCTESRCIGPPSLPPWINSQVPTKMVHFVNYKEKKTSPPLALASCRTPYLLQPPQHVHLVKHYLTCDSLQLSLLMRMSNCHTCASF